MSDLDERLSHLIGFIRRLYGTGAPIPLHAPHFGGNEKQYLLECIDSTFVSSIGPFVSRFESMMQTLTGAKYAIATVNGTSALHLALAISGVSGNDEVITQPLSFVATSNAIAYLQAHPLFVDVDRDTLSLSPAALEVFLNAHGERRHDGCFNRRTGRRIAAVVPMHTFGFAGRIAEIAEICALWGLPLIEDAAEALGTTVGSAHAGTFGLMGAFSFNGNKTVTAGGGGCIITNDENIAQTARHLSTTAKLPHAWDFFHDQVGYNYRLPNINAALACAQLEQLPSMLENKRSTAQAYADFCAGNNIDFVTERKGTRSNFWLNTILTRSKDERDALLKFSHQAGVMTRPAWTLLNKLPAFQGCDCAPLDNALWLEDRIVNLPSSVRINVDLTGRA